VATIVVNVSDAKASGDAAATLATYSLGSCIGVSLYDPQAQVAGMLHFQLPTSTLDPAKAKQNPAMFADSGMAHLLDRLTALGADRRRLRVRLAGAAQMFDDGGVFNIGKRNHAAIRKFLWQAGMLIDKEEIGGTAPRTLYLRVVDGVLTVKSGADTHEM